jgi:hypothetical protein
MDIIQQILWNPPIPEEKRYAKRFNLTRKVVTPTVKYTKPKEYNNPSDVNFRLPSASVKGLDRPKQFEHVYKSKPDTLAFTSPKSDVNFRLPSASVKGLDRPKQFEHVYKSKPDTLTFTSPKSDRKIVAPKPVGLIEPYVIQQLNNFNLPNLPKYIPPKISKKVQDEPEIEISIKINKKKLSEIQKLSLPTKKRVYFEENTLLVPKETVKISRASTPKNKRTFVPKKYIIPKFVVEKSKLDVEYADIDIFDIYYNVPQRTDVAVMLVFFDYTGSARILMNYLYMVEKLKLANIPVFTLELVIHGKQPRIKDAFYVYGSSYLFQKEHLLRLLEKRIPPEFTKLACLDSDILFDNPDWYDTLSDTLETCHVVQAFKEAFWLNLDYSEIQAKAQSISSYNPKLYRSFFIPGALKFHTGFGWCFTRDWYNRVGYYDLAVIGSGDTIFSHALFDFINVPNTQEFRLYISSMHDWWKNNSDGVRFSSLDTNLYHMYHGSIRNRQYYDRYKPFKSYTNIEDIITKNDNEVYELTVPELNDHMSNFFKTREDDGID